MAEMTHFQLTLAEAKESATHKWINPQDFAAQPWMLCRTGDGHARGSRSIPRVTCKECLKRLKDANAAAQQ